MPMKPQAPDSTAPTTKPMAVVLSRKTPINNGQHHAHDGDGFVLARQISGRALLNGARNFLHARIACVCDKIQLRWTNP
jgi:hypothetical protein